MTLERTNFHSIPTDTGYRGGLYGFVRDDSGDGVIYVCNGDEAKVRMLSNEILSALETVEVMLVATTIKDKIAKLVYAYGEAKVDVARGDWYESETGASL